MKVIPKVGADRVRFGMTREEVRGLLGDPDEVEPWDWPDDSQSEEWKYESPGLSAGFDDDVGWRLASLTLTDAEIGSVRPMGMRETEALEALACAGVPPIVLSDDFSELGSKDYECDEWEMSLWISDGVVTSVTLFPEYDESGDHPIWPEGETG
jgi:hypothetical protein